MYGRATTETTESVKDFSKKKYYWMKRYLKWYLGADTYAKKKQSAPLKYAVFTHQTVLLRQLKDVDMLLQLNKVRKLNIATEKLSGY